MSTNTIKEAPWKISFNPTGNGPYAVKVKLYDLLFDSSGVLRYNSGNGLNLPHDIILFDPAAYSTTGGGTIDPTALSDTRKAHGIWLSKVTYDARANATFVPNDAYALMPAGDPNYNRRGYYIYSSEAALAPLETDYSTLANKTYYDTSLASTAFTDKYTDPATGVEYTMCYASSCTAAVLGLPAAISSAIILSSPDLALQSTIPGSSLQPYTKMYLRGDLSNSEIVSILQFFTSYGINSDGTPISSTLYPISTLLDVAKNPHLLDVEVWVRCSYFADYIIPDSFGQNLTESSPVAHENLILGQGDFARFTRDDTAIDSPYIPITIPRNDILQISQVANAAAFPIPPVKGTYASATTTSNTPAGWANYDLLVQSGTVTVPAGLIAVPQAGNAYVSGRIFSPTIDELWIYIKKLVDGQGTNGATSIPAEPALTLSGGVGDPISADGSTFVAKPASITYSVDTALQNTANGIINIAGNNYTFFVPTSNPTPRANPYSLREIESLIDNLQYNLRTVMNFYAANAAKTGNINTTIGTLYQLHKSYSPFSPATWQWTVANTYKATETDATHGGTLPTSSGGYDRTKDFTAGDTYLSADGQWHYLFDHVRVPVLVETY